MDLTPSIFKAYDIRGIVGHTLDEAWPSTWAARSAPRPRRRARRPWPSAATAASRARRCRRP